jgi:hypothetical protein
MIAIPVPKFDLGKIVATPGAIQALKESKQSAFHFVARHMAGDWGEELPPEDCLANEQALLDNSRVFSAYRTARGTKLWVITEADRSLTTIMRPEDY